MSEKMSIEEYKEKMKELFDECEKVLAQFKGDTLAELKESKKEGKWQPKKREFYWFRGLDGLLHTDCYTNDYDEWRINNLPIFPTKEECERYWHFMDTVKEKSYEFSKKEVANEDIWRFSICYIPSRNSFVITHNIECKYLGTTYFKTEEDAQYIIDNFKDELMEYWI